MGEAHGEIVSWPLPCALDVSLLSLERKGIGEESSGRSVLNSGNVSGKCAQEHRSIAFVIGIAAKTYRRKKEKKKRNKKRYVAGQKFQVPSALTRQGGNSFRVVSFAVRRLSAYLVDGVLLLEYVIIFFFTVMMT